MKPWMRLVLFLLLAALGAGTACYIVSRFTQRHEAADLIENHQWIHRELHLTSDEEKSLEAIEQKFHRERHRLTDVIRLGNQEMADALRADKGDSPLVREAVRKINQAQGELQTAVLEHVFNMKSALTPEQYDRLIQLTADALSKATESK